MILLQPVLDCSKQRHSFLRTHSPLQKKYSSCKEIQKKESRKSLDYNKMSKKIENFSKLVQGALFETHRSQDQIVPSKTLRSESFLQMTHSSYELICTKALASRCLLLRSIVQIKNGFRLHSLELYTANTRQIPVEKLNCQDLVVLVEKAQKPKRPPVHVNV